MGAHITVPRDAHWLAEYNRWHISDVRNAYVRWLAFNASESAALLSGARSPKAGDKKSPTARMPRGASFVAPHHTGDAVGRHPLARDLVRRAFFEIFTAPSGAGAASLPLEQFKLLKSSGSDVVDARKVLTALALFCDGSMDARADVVYDIFADGKRECDRADIAELVMCVSRVLHKLGIKHRELVSFEEADCLAELIWQQCDLVQRNRVTSDDMQAWVRMQLDRRAFTSLFDDVDSIAKSTARRESEDTARTLPRSGSLRGKQVSSSLAAAAGRGGPAAAARGTVTLPGSAIVVQVAKKLANPVYAGTKSQQDQGTKFPHNRPPRISTDDGGAGSVPRSPHRRSVVDSTSTHPSRKGSASSVGPTRSRRVSSGPRSGGITPLSTGSRTGGTTTPTREYARFDDEEARLEDRIAAATLKQKQMETYALKLRSIASDQSLRKLTGETKFSLEELQVMAAGVCEASDVRGTLTPAKLYRILRTFTPLLARANSFRVFDVIDVNHDGTVSFREFVMAMNTVCRGSQEDRTRLAFRVYDDDQDGYITVVALVTFLKSCSNNSALSRMVETTEKLLAALDENDDGEVTREEFTNAMMSDPAVMTIFTRCVAVTRHMATSIVELRTRCSSFRFEALCALWRKGGNEHGPGYPGGPAALRKKLRSHVGKAAFVEFMRRCFEVTDAEELLVKDIFAAFDIANRDHIDLRGVLNGFAQILADTAPQRISFFFDLYDADGNGTLDPNEILFMLLSSQENVDDSVSLVNRLAKFDSDGDGLIAESDFVLHGQRDDLVSRSVDMLCTATCPVSNMFGADPRKTAGKNELVARATLRKLNRIASVAGVARTVDKAATILRGKLGKIRATKGAAAAQKAPADDHEKKEPEGHYTRGKVSFTNRRMGAEQRQWSIKGLGTGSRTENISVAASASSGGISGGIGSPFRQPEYSKHGGGTVRSLLADARAEAILVGPEQRGAASIGKRGEVSTERHARIAVMKTAIHLARETSVRNITMLRSARNSGANSSRQLQRLGGKPKPIGVLIGPGSETPDRSSPDSPMMNSATEAFIPGGKSAGDAVTEHKRARFADAGAAGSSRSFGSGAFDSERSLLGAAVKPASAAEVVAARIHGPPALRASPVTEAGGLANVRRGSDRQSGSPRISEADLTPRQLRKARRREKRRKKRERGLFDAEVHRGRSGIRKAAVEQFGWDSGSVVATD